MGIERYNSNGRFHEAVIHNGVLYMSGKIAAGETTAEQTANILSDLEVALEKYGSDKESIISACVYLADIADFNAFNAVWDAWFKEGTQPVRTCVEAALAKPEFRVEITVIAALK